MRFPGNVALESVVSTDMKTWKTQFMVVLLLALALATGCADEALKPVQLAPHDMLIRWAGATVSDSRQRRQVRCGIRPSR